MNEYAYQVYLDTRLSGQVTRYHTWPRVRDQSVAEHSWQLLRIYSCLVDSLDPNFIMHCIYHDTAEIVTGDLPYPVKSKNPALKEVIERLEADTINKQADYWNVAPYKITDEQLGLFKLIEMVEMFEWGLDEMSRGCKYGSFVADRCLKVVYEKLQLKPLPKPWHALSLYVFKRLMLFETTIPIDNEWWHITQWERLIQCASSA